jgi:hypothetical protein
MRKPPLVTASEIAEYVYCHHAWSLRQEKVPVSTSAHARMSAGVAWQAAQDQEIANLSARAGQFQEQSRRAWGFVYMAAIAMVGLWLLQSFLR